MRKRIYEIIEVSKDNDKVSLAYDILMMCAIIISIIPLAFKGTNIVFRYINNITAMAIFAFVVDKRTVVRYNYMHRTLKKYRVAI